jgi:hypothetical protein
LTLMCGVKFDRIDLTDNQLITLSLDSTKVFK